MTDVTKILCDLINIKTDNPNENNNLIIDYIINFFNNNQIPFVRLKNQTGPLFNLVAGINVSDLSDISEGILLSCHLDTVSATTDEWGTPPFKATIQNNAIFGRGAVDMKQSIAVILANLAQLKQINKPIILCFSADEETAGQGISSIINFLQQKNIHPKFGIVLEPTNGQIGIENKGYKGFQTKIIGLACHSSKPEQGINALYIAARLISFIEQTALLYQNSGLTLNVGIAKGGTGCNLVAPDATVEFEIRSNSNQLTETVCKQIQAYHLALSKEYRGTPVTLFETENLPAFSGNLESKLISAIQKESPLSSVKKLPYATEAGIYQSYGIDTVIFGAGNETLAHTNNEHIQITELEHFQQTLLNTLNNLFILD